MVINFLKGTAKVYTISTGFHTMSNIAHIMGKKGSIGYVVGIYWHIRATYYVLGKENSSSSESLVRIKISNKSIILIWLLLFGAKKQVVLIAHFC
jgi:hypothetical protein